MQASVTSSAGASSASFRPGRGCPACEEPVAHDSGRAWCAGRSCNAEYCVCDCTCLLPETPAPMKLIAVLSWYDEPAWCLTELVTSLGKAGADAIVAVDGAYALFPEGRAQSPSEQSQAILAAAQGCGMEVVLHLPREVWFGNEVEKRTFSLNAAHEIALAGEDWIWICDGDEVVTEADGLREALEQTEHDTADILMDEVLDGSREGVHPIRKFFRAQEQGIELEHNHFTFWSGDQLLYEGFQTPRPDLATSEVLNFVRIDHRRGARSEQRNYRAQVYYDRRKELKAELVPG